MISNVHGQFSKVTGTLEFNDNNPAMDSVKATIDASTVNTQEPKRDEHLKSPDFLDVAKFPTITFHVDELPQGGRRANTRSRGDLTIHGVTKRVVLDVDGPTAEVKDPWGNAGSASPAPPRSIRSDYGLTWNKALEAGGVHGGRRSVDHSRGRVRQEECHCLSNT